MYDFRDYLSAYAEEPLPRQVILDLLKNYKRPNDKINELIKEGLLSNVIRGLYVSGPNLKITSPENLLVANHLRGPSYISLESALSYWKLIPEKVYETISVTMKTGKKYHTPIGRFMYISVPFPYYSYGIQIVKLTAKQVVLMASPEKAICDKIIATSGVFLRSTKQAFEFLTGDMRMEESQLGSLDTDTIESWLPEAPKKTSLQTMIKTLRTL